MKKIVIWLLVWLLCINLCVGIAVAEAVMIPNVLEGFEEIAIWKRRPKPQTSTPCGNRQLNFL